MTAETERIAHRTLHIALLRLVERQIESGVDFGIEVFVVDRRGNHTVVDRKDAGQRLDSTGSTNRCPVMDLVDEILTS